MLQEIKDQVGLWRCICGLSEAMLGLGKTQPSTVLWGGAEALSEHVGEPRSPKEQIQYDLCLIRARKELGEETFAAAWEMGRTMTIDQVVGYALEDTPQ